jgi:hypothetical protein
MSQRGSGYERQDRDQYETPEWVTEALLPHIHITPDDLIWEPAAGTGKMVRVLEKAGLKVNSSDIAGDVPIDFLTVEDHQCSAIITNPPYALAQEFIEHALRLTKWCDGLVAMLLRTDFDHAVRRQHLFGKCAQFARKVVLTKRIVWFDGPNAAPSFNHAWYVWSWKHSGLPTLTYGP